MPEIPEVTLERAERIRPGLASAAGWPEDPGGWGSPARGDCE